MCINGFWVNYEQVTLDTNIYGYFVFIRKMNIPYKQFQSLCREEAYYYILPAHFQTSNTPLFS